MKAYAIGIALVLLVAISTLLPVASASPLKVVTGTFTEESTTVTPLRFEGGITILRLQGMFTIAGSFQGTSVTDLMAQVRATGEGTFEGRETFVGSLVTASGTLTGTLVVWNTGKIDGASIEGKFTIVGGTGGLANVRGLVTFVATAGSGTYTGSVHMAP